MICPKCGNECDDNQMFCNACGTKLKNFVPTDQEEIVVPDRTRPTSNIHREESRTAAINTGNKGKNDNFLNKENKGKNDNALNKENKKPKKNSRRLESELLDNDNITDAGFASKKTKAKYKNDKYNVPSNKNVNPKKSGKNVAIVALIAIVAVVATVAITISIKKASMTKKFNQYYNNGTVYYNQQNYKDARTQFYTASNNAVTNEQRVKSYVMVYKVDSIIGGYEKEEIEFLEALIAIDNSNIDYYKELIVLYQNNDMNSKIEPLIAGAPSNMKKELTNYNGTIPVANYKEGVYRNPINVELSSSNDVTIYYTTDGSNAIESETKTEYSSPIKLKKEGIYTIRAYSVDKNGKASKEMTIKYTLEFIKVDAPIIKPDSGKYTSNQKIEATAASDTIIYYTTDGTTPTTKSKKYKGAIDMPKGDSIYYFIAVNAEGVVSDVTTRVYNFTPEYSKTYDEALESLKRSIGGMDIIFNDNDDGDIYNFEYREIAEISDKYYYIISCEMTTKKNKTKSTTYAVSCDDAICYKASYGSDGNYSISTSNDD